MPCRIIHRPGTKRGLIDVPAMAAVGRTASLCGAGHESVPLHAEDMQFCPPTSRPAFGDGNGLKEKEIIHRFVRLDRRISKPGNSDRDPLIVAFFRTKFGDYDTIGTGFVRSRVYG